MTICAGIPTTFTPRNTTLRTPVPSAHWVRALLPLLIASPAAAQSVELGGLPPTPRRVVTDHYHGHAVDDPYRWLEHVDAPAVSAWAHAQDGVTRAALDGASDRGIVRRRIRTHTSTHDYSVPVRRGERLFHLVLEPEARHNAVAVRRGGDEAIVLAPSAPITQIVPSPGGDRVLVTLTPEGGAPSRTLLVSVDDGATREVLSRGRVPRSAWTADGRGYFYLVPDRAGGETLVLRHPALEQDRTLSPSLTGAEPGDELEASVTDGGGWLTVTARREGRERITVARLDSVGIPQQVTRLLEGRDRHHLVAGQGGRFWFRTTEGAPRGRVIRVDVAAPARVEEVDEVVEIVPETEATLVDAFLFGGKLVGYYLLEAKPHVEIFRLDGTRERTVELPLGLVFTDYLRGWPGFAGDPEHPHVYFRSLNLTAPGIYRLDVTSGRVAPFLPRGVAVDASKFVTRHVEFESADGTRVPMFVAHRNDVALDGSAPALMFAYGAYGWTPVPFFNAKYLTFLEAGGVFAIPYARGGGLRGDAWHRAGTRERKQRTIDDVIGAAQWLIGNGYTRADRLALEGQGPGGAGVGGAVTQRPDLFAAAIFDVAVSDMLRREAAGNAMLSELGTVEDAAEFAALLAYSPYHAVLRGGAFPAALVKSGDRDTVVPPMHAYKLVAGLQAHGVPGRPYLLRMEWSTGHGFGKGLECRRREWIDDLIFLRLTLDGLAFERLGAGDEADDDADAALAHEASRDRRVAEGTPCA